MSRCGVYRIVHLLTGREYIGQAQDIDYRWKVHRRRLKGGYHHALHLQNAWRRYGGIAFAFEVLEICEIASLDACEQHWIDARRPVFNTALIAGSTRGVRPSAATRAKLAKAGTGRKHSEETKAMIGAANRGRKHSEESRAKMRGRVKSPEEIERMRSKLIGRKLSPEHRAKVGRKGPKHSPETIAKMRAGLTGQKRTPEQRERMRQAALLREIRKKEKQDASV